MCTRSNSACVSVSRNVWFTEGSTAGVCLRNAQQQGCLLNMHHCDVVAGARQRVRSREAQRRHVGGHLWGLLKDQQQGFT